MFIGSASDGDIERMRSLLETGISVDITISVRITCTPPIIGTFGLPLQLILLLAATDFQRRLMNHC